MVDNGIDPAAFVHENALIEPGSKVGAGSRIWAFAHLLPGAVVGRDCNICDHTLIEGTVVVGDRVTVKSGVYLWDGLEVEDDVFIGPAAVFTNDLKPRSRHRVEYEKTLLKQGASIGANSTVLAGNTVGRWALVGAGSVITRDVPDFAAVAGNPARLFYWICRCTKELSFDSTKAVCSCGRVYELDEANNKVEECD